MIEIELINDAKRLKRPRIQRATVPGESEKVNIVYNVKSSPEKVTPITDNKKLINDATADIKTSNPKA